MLTYLIKNLFIQDIPVIQFLGEHKEHNILQSLSALMLKTQCYCISNVFTVYHFGFFFIYSYIFKSHLKEKLKRFFIQIKKR